MAFARRRWRIALRTGRIRAVLVRRVASPIKRLTADALLRIFPPSSGLYEYGPP
jgi:hypothetical protein